MSYKMVIVGPLFKCSQSLKVLVDLEAARQYVTSFKDVDPSIPYVLMPQCEDVDSCAYSTPLYECRYIKTKSQVDYRRLRVSYLVAQDFSLIGDTG